MNFIEGGDNAIGSFVMCSTVPWKMGMPPDNTTLAYNRADVNVDFHDAVERSVVESAASSPVKLGWNNTSTQRKRTTLTVMILTGNKSVLSLSVSAVDVSFVS